MTIVFTVNGVTHQVAEQVDSPLLGEIGGSINYTTPILEKELISHLSQWRVEL